MLQCTVNQRQGAFYVVIPPSHFASQMASSHVPGDGFSYLGGTFASSYGAGWRRWYFTSAGHLFRPAETCILYQFDPVFKDVSERSTLFEFGTWVNLYIFQISGPVLFQYPGFVISMLRKRMWHSIAFLIIQPTRRGHRHWQLHEPSVGQPILCARILGSRVERATWNSHWVILFCCLFRYF